LRAKFFLLLNVLTVAAFASEEETKAPPVEKKKVTIEKTPEADDSETKLVLQSLSQRYEALGSWEATFNQTEKSPGFAEAIASEGYFKFVLPNKFLLATRGAKMVKKFVSDGTSAVYIEDRGKELSAADRFFARRFPDSKNLELEKFLLFFRGLKKGKASQKDFTVSGHKLKGDLDITLVPKKDSDFSEIRIVFANADKFPKDLIFKDALGGETDLKIMEAKNITDASPKWFDLTLPKGAKIDR